MIYAYIFVSLTLLVLIIGIGCMALGGRINKKLGTRLMAARVIFQAIAIIALAIVYFITR